MIDLEGAIDGVEIQLSVAELEHDLEYHLRLSLTRDFIRCSIDPSTARRHLAVTAGRLLKVRSSFGDDNLIEAETCLFALPHQARAVRERLMSFSDRTGLRHVDDPAAAPSAELVTLYNLALLIEGGRAAAPALLPIPRRRTDVARAILEGTRAPLSRLVRADCARVAAAPHSSFADPRKWWPIFATLVADTAARFGQGLPVFGPFEA